MASTSPISVDRLELATSSALPSVAADAAGHTDGRVTRDEIVRYVANVKAQLASAPDAVSARARGLAAEGEQVLAVLDRINVVDGYTDADIAVAREIAAAYVEGFGRRVLDESEPDARHWTDASATSKALHLLARGRGLSGDRADDIAWMAYQLLFPTADRFNTAGRGTRSQDLVSGSLYMLGFNADNDKFVVSNKDVPIGGSLYNETLPAEALKPSIYASRPFLQAIADKNTARAKARAIREHDIKAAIGTPQEQSIDVAEGAVAERARKMLDSSWGTYRKAADKVSPMLTSDDGAVRTAGNIELRVLLGKDSRGYQLIDRPAYRADLAEDVVAKLTDAQLKQLEPATLAHLIFALQHDAVRTYDAAGVPQRDGDEVMPIDNPRWVGIARDGQCTELERRALERVIEACPKTMDVTHYGAQMIDQNGYPYSTVSSIEIR